MGGSPREVSWHDLNIYLFGFRVMTAGMTFLICVWCLVGFGHLAHSIVYFALLPRLVCRYFHGESVIRPLAG